MDGSPKGPAPARCPGCDNGHLQVTRFKASCDRSRPRLKQLGEYTPGGIQPTVVVVCTGDCGFVAEGPGEGGMVGTLLTSGPGGGVA